MWNEEPRRERCGRNGNNLSGSTVRSLSWSFEGIRKRFESDCFINSQRY